MDSTSYRNSFDEQHKEASVALNPRRMRRKQVDAVAVHVPQFLFRLGREPISLSWIEYRIVRFLSEKPYKAFTRGQIVQAIDSERHSVPEETLDEHIRTLRSKLGLFSDYVQSVPFIGYRFKP